VSKQTSAAVPIRAMNLNDRVAIITGAAQGIGRAFAQAYAAAGAITIVSDINMDKASDVVATIASTGGRAMSIRADVGDLASMESLARRTMEEFGRIDILMNNAGIFSTIKMRPFEQIPVEEWNAVLNVNITGVMFGCRAVVPFMRQRNWGRIINMSSGAVSLGRPNYLHYTTSKAALIGMTRSLARELGPAGITVNAIMPGAVFTEIPRETVTPEQKERIISSQCIQRPETPDDLVGTALFLSGEESAFMTGQCLTVDGGATHR
jgi:NAD(P)-dependent dehydrogenase (short-subunit alcohol dehydrogenase family)